MKRFISLLSILTVAIAGGTALWSCDDQKEQPADPVEEGQEEAQIVDPEEEHPVDPGEEGTDSATDDTILGWNISYLGCQWVEGYETEGQMEVFEVSGTDTDMYYYPVLIHLDFEDDCEAAIREDYDGYFAGLQESIDETVGSYLEYGYALKDIVDSIFYNEIKDGTRVIFYGVQAGDYQFAVFPLDANGKLDGRYKVLSFSKESDAELIYDWPLIPNFREDWTGHAAEWYEGFEGEYYWVDGLAPGAKYVIIDTFTEEELDQYAKGEIKNVIGTKNADIQYYIHYYCELLGYTLEEFFTWYGTDVDENDGSFSDYISSYGLTGETNLIIIGFDANGNLVNTSAVENGGDYGMNVIEIPEYEEPSVVEPSEPVELFLQEEWSVQPGEPYNYKDGWYECIRCDVVVNAPDIRYFAVEEDTDEDVEYWYGSVADMITGWSEYYSAEIAGGQDIGNYLWSLDDEPYITVWNPGVETNIYLAEFDEAGVATGRYSATPVIIPEVRGASAPWRTAVLRFVRPGDGLH